MLQVRDAKTGGTVVSMSHDRAQFVVAGLVPGRGYVVTVHAANGKVSCDWWRAVT